MNALAVFSPNDPVAVVWGGTSGIGLAIFLASDASELVTGQTIPVDGGFLQRVFELGGKGDYHGGDKGVPALFLPAMPLKRSAASPVGPAGGRPNRSVRCHRN